jgi:hypothetical protein
LLEGYSHGMCRPCFDAQPNRIPSLAVLRRRSFELRARSAELCRQSERLLGRWSGEMRLSLAEVWRRAD